jgi:ubiquinone/menaquinone biosynthesis C-methylase UbiE
MNRRELFPLASTLAAFATTAGVQPVLAKTVDVKIDPRKQPPDMEAKHEIRLTRLDDQSAADFLGSFRMAMGTVNRDMSKILNAHLSSKGVDTKADHSLEEAYNLAMQHPNFQMSARMWVSGQEQMWRIIAETFHNRADEILAELEKTDNAGPGKLELNPGMKIPDSARHEIHIQPGGYVGDPFAGAISQYGSKQFGRGLRHLWNDRQERHMGMAQEMPLPSGGDVKRILDMGCGWGSLATALKIRFPEAEVWGVDVGGPQVRWGHYRAIKLGLDVNFRQALAEDTKFPDNHFDIVTSYIMHHEVDPETHAKIVAEGFRILRPGGVFRPIDFVTKGNPAYQGNNDIARKAGTYQDHRWNNEVWAPSYRSSDFPGVLKKAGFVEMTVGANANFQNVYGFKPV